MRIGSFSLDQSKEIGVVLSNFELFRSILTIYKKGKSCKT